MNANVSLKQSVNGEFEQVQMDWDRGPYGDFSVAGITSWLSQIGTRKH